MVVIPMVVILIAFWFSQHPIVFWVLIGTSILILIALKILVSKYEATHPYQGSPSRRVYKHRSSSRKGVLHLVASIGKTNKRKSRGGVRSSLIGLHRR